MSAQIHCPACHTQLLAPPELAGQVVACPTCRQTIQLVAQAAAQPAVPLQHGATSGPKGLPRARPIPSGPQTSGPQIMNPQAAPAALVQSAAIPAPARPTAPRHKGFPLAALLSWSFILACIIVPAFLLWRMRTNHLEQIAAGKSAKAVQAANEQPTSVVAERPRAPSGVSPTNVTVRPQAPAAQSHVSASPPASTPVNPPTPVASAPPTPAPTLPVVVDIFSTLGAHWQLPTLISTAAEPLGSLQTEPDKPLDVAVRYDATSIPAGAVLFAERASEPGEWTIGYVSNLQATEGKVPLATLRLAGRDWSWQWIASESNVPLRRQLANCQLHLRHGDAQRIMQLRAPTALPALKIDLEETQKLEFQVAELPKAELLRLAIDGLDGFADGASVDKPSLAVGESAKITFSSRPGAEIELRFRTLASGSLVLQLEPRFREPNGRTYEMTLPRLDAMEDGASKALKSAEKELPQKQRELAAAVSAWKSLANSPPKNPLLTPAWQGEVGSLESKAKRAASRVESLQKQIPMHVGRLNAVPATRSFLQAIDERASIRLRLVAQCPDQELLLVAATLPVAAD
jgi:hypothetical protein